MNRSSPRHALRYYFDLSSPDIRPLECGARSAAPVIDGALSASTRRDALRARFYMRAPRGQGDPSSEQHSQESLRVVARRHSVNQKTIAEWKKRFSTADPRTGTGLAGQVTVTNGRVERINQTIKEVTVNASTMKVMTSANVLCRLHGRLQLRSSPQYVKRDHALRIHRQSPASEPNWFIGNLIHQMPGLNISSPPPARPCLRTGHRP